MNENIEIDEKFTPKPTKDFFEMNIPFDMTKSDDAVQLSELTKFIWDGINDGYSAFVVTHTIDHDLTNN